jgi:hypothetical protein
MLVQEVMDGTMQNQKNLAAALNSGWKILLKLSVLVLVNFQKF